MTLPEGLIYVRGFLAEAEERDVLTVLATFELQPYVLHDTPSRRLVRSFGAARVAGAYDVGPVVPIPAGLEWLRRYGSASRPPMAGPTRPSSAPRRGGPASRRRRWRSSRARPDATS
jgi:hypothetical protein